MIATILDQLTVGSAFLLFLGANVVLFASSMAFGHTVGRLFGHRRVTAPAPRVERREIALAVVCVTLNAAVTVGGLLLYRAGILRLAAPSAFEIVYDALLLTLLMDIAMYASHRFAHHPWFYAHVHALHHRYEHPRPLSLFVLHPLEVLGFGALWLMLICLVRVSLPAMILFLTLNLLFGMLGHVGVEPLPDGWVKWPFARSVGTSTFHARHHERPRSNFGFYTTVWDRLFGTIDSTYAADFGRVPTLAPAEDRP